MLWVELVLQKIRRVLPTPQVPQALALFGRKVAADIASLGEVRLGCGPAGRVHTLWEALGLTPSTA